MNTFISLLRLELRREVRKRSFYFLLLVSILPVMVTLILKYGLHRSIESKDLWAVALGLKSTGGFGLLEGASLSNWAWLIALLYGGDLLASDLSDGTARLILSRGVRRWEYMLSKVLTVSIFLSIIFALSGLGAYISNTILVGGLLPLGDMVEAVGLGALMGIGTLPLLLLAALLGTLSRKPVYGIVLGFVAYIVISIAISMYAFLLVMQGSQASGMEMVNQMEFQANLTSSIVKVTGYIPYTAGLNIASMIYWLIEGGVVREPILTAYGVEMDAGPLALLYTTTTIIGIILHIILLYYILDRMDL